MTISMNALLTGKRYGKMKAAKKEKPLLSREQMD
jgi:hypothetical protein